MPDGADGLLVALRGVASPATVLHLGAHPDDEEGDLLAHVTVRLAGRAVYWSATRGESGANRAGPDRGPALGVVRTWESLGCRAVDGGEVLYGPFLDYGYTKTGEGALRRWGRECVLREVVRAVRLVRPLVVVARWTGTASDGHGHHQAVGLVSAEGVAAAADPTCWPELGLPTWAAPKLYRSTVPDWQPGEDAVFGAVVPEHEEAGLLRTDTGDHDLLLGRSVHELAAEAASRHVSQGVAAVPRAVPYVLYHRLERSAVPVPDRETGLLDGLPVTLAGLCDLLDVPSPAVRAALAEVDDAVADAVAVLRPDDPTAAGRHVVRAVAALDRAAEALAPERAARPVVPPGGPVEALADEVRHRRAAASEVAARCLGLRLDCDLDRASVSPGGRVRAVARLRAPAGTAARPARPAVVAPAGWSVRPVEVPDAPRDVGLDTLVGEVAAPPDAALTAPYWTLQPGTPEHYTWPEDDRCGAALDPPVLHATCDVEVSGVVLRLTTPGVARDVAPSGLRVRPLAVLPPVSLAPRQRREYLLAGADDRELDVEVELVGRAAEPVDGVVRLTVPDGWTAEPSAVELVGVAPGEVRSLRFGVHVPARVVPGRYAFEVSLEVGTARYGVAVDPVRQGPGGRTGVDGATALREAFLMPPAQVDVHVVDVATVPHLRHAYVDAAGDELPETLGALGLAVDVLDDEDLAHADLSVYDSVLVGPGAYVLRGQVRAVGGRLLDYVAHGGTLVVLHQTYPFQLDGLTPWPFRYSQPHDRVTDPAAPVTVLRPDHPVLRTPNPIGPADFEGWVHDRGMYFAGEWDRRYAALLSCADPGEEQQDGGLLVTSVGQGTWAYVGYSLARQVAAGVPGGLRLLVNLLALPEARLQERVALARGVPLFDGLGEEALRGVARRMTERWYAPGDVLCRQGEHGDELYVVLEGEVEVLRADEDGVETLDVQGPGWVVGLLAVVADVVRTATLRARGDVRVLVVQEAPFRALLAESPETAGEVIAALVAMLTRGEPA